MSTPFKWFLGIVALVFVLVLVAAWPSKERTQRDAAQARHECAKAMASSMNAPVRTYADKAAYDSAVREKCRDFEINGKPIVD